MFFHPASFNHPYSKDSLMFSPSKNFLWFYLLLCTVNALEIQDIEKLKISLISIIVYFIETCLSSVLPVDLVSDCLHTHILQGETRCLRKPKFNSPLLKAKDRTYSNCIVSQMNTVVF